jgi:tetratricopeptide (TPR) repeat protein
MKSTFYYILSLILLLGACSGESYRKHIQALEKEYRKTGQKHFELYNAYMDYCESYPGDSTYIIKASVFLLSNSMEEDAVGLLSGLIKQYPGYAAAYAHRADAYFRMNMMDSVIADISKAEKNAISPEKYSKRKGFYLRQKAGMQKIDSLDQVLKEKPHDTTAYLQRGQVFLQLNNPNAAVFDFNKTLALDSAYAPGYYHLGRAFLVMDSSAIAKQNYRKAAKLEPENKIYANALKRMEFQAQLEKELQAVNAKIDQNPQSHLFYLDKARVYAKYRYYEKALETILHAKQLNDLDPNVYHALAIVNLRMGNTDEALLNAKKVGKLGGAVNPALKAELEKVGK